MVAAITNTMRSKKSDRVWTWKDFFPDIDYEQPSQSVEDQIAIVELLNEAFGGNDERKHKEPTIA